MAIFVLSSEHTRSSAFDRVREFCKGKKIRVTKTWMDEIFTNFAHIRISCESKRDANKVQKFIWEEINHGAHCEIKKIS